MSQLDPIATLKMFQSEHPELGLHNRNQQDLSAFLIYWAVEIHGLPAVDAVMLNQLFNALDLAEPTATRSILSKLKAKRQVVKTGSGYKPSAHLKETVKQQLQEKPPLLKAAPHIESLLQKVTRPDAKSFLEEAHLCLRANAPRAAMVMTWIVVVDHLFEYVLAHKLTDFNIALAKKNPKAKLITTKDDFSDLKEKDFIEVCRSAGVFNNDLRKILDERLGNRNTAGHPSTVTIHGGKAAGFIEDLVDNVILKLPI
jgi:hypothetical protein